MKDLFTKITFIVKWLRNNLLNNRICILFMIQIYTNFINTFIQSDEKSALNFLSKVEIFQDEFTIFIFLYDPIPFKSCRQCNFKSQNHVFSKETRHYKFYHLKKYHFRKIMGIWNLRFKKKLQIFSSNLYNLFSPILFWFGTPITKKYYKFYAAKLFFW